MQETTFNFDWEMFIVRMNKIAVFTDNNNSATITNLGQNEHIIYKYLKF